MNTFRSWRILVTAFLVLLALCGDALAASQRQLVYFGTYTGAKSKGIYVSTLDLKTGALTPPTLAVETRNPTFLAVHPNNQFLYAINEIGNYAGTKDGSVTAFALADGGSQLTLLNHQSSGGSGPCHLIVDRAGKNVLLANYGGGSVESIPIQADGRLSAPTTFIQHQGSSVNPRRQEGPHGHCIQLDAANRFAYACDLGLDQVLIYRFDAAKGTLTPHQPPFAAVKAGAGPRHLAFTPNGRHAYVINELDCTLTAFAGDAQSGMLKELETVSTLPAGDAMQPRFSTAEVEVHPSGKFVYGSNRGHDTIAVWAIEAKTGKLAYVEHQPTQGKTPRSFGIDPTGKYLLAANQDSGSVVVFRIDAKTGRLQPTENRIEVGAPVCVKFMPLK